MGSRPQDEKLRRRQEEDRLACDIVDECRVQLMLRFRFLDRALWRMGLEPVRAGGAYPLATDGERVLCDPPRAIARFRGSFDESVRDCLHLVMHCIFLHPFAKARKNREAWSLTCDIIAESAAMEMCGGRFASADDPARGEALSELRMLVGRLLPGKVYDLVEAMVETPEGQHHRGLGRSALNQWHDLFERDDHGAWPAFGPGAGEGADDGEPSDREGDGAADGIRTQAAGDQDEADAPPPELPQPQSAAGTEGADEAEGDQAAPDAGAEEADERQGGDAAESGEGAGHQPSAEEPERQWRDLAKQMEMDLQTFSREWGEGAGELMANLAVANRQRCDYSGFLRRFMVVAEEMQLNMDEFDYAYYSYGMELYRNMPLVEPLEYKESKRVRDFAIVLDTSESVSGPLVRRFVEHTFEMRKSSEDYATSVNVHVIQCDSKVQSDLKVTDLRDVDALMEGFVVRGFGGTDFRPAFAYVDALAKRGEFGDLKGLVYFTDGYGSFPEKAPGYDVAFVFMEQEGEPTPPVPPWAMKVTIDEDAMGELGKGAAL